MLARKCDRCGEYYDQYQETFSICKVKTTSFCGGGTATKRDGLDICPKCEAKLVDWLHIAKDE